MRLPALQPIRQTTEGVTKFGGYDHRLKIGDNRFYDMRNMTAERLPVMSTRERRGYLRALEKPNGLFAHDKLCWVDGTDFYYDGEIVGQVTDSEKQFARMGAYVLIWPDAAYYNSRTEAFGTLGATTVTTGAVSCALCRPDGATYDAYTLGDTAPASPDDGDCWMDTRKTPHVLKYFSEVGGMWTSVPTVYTRIAATGIGAAFSQYDGVSLSGFTNSALNGDFYIAHREADAIAVIALIDEAFTQNAAVTVERKIPQLDFICERDNRLWGCCSAKHEIYACALGDPKNWNQYIGQETDSFAVSVGSGGAFTGCIAHQGNVLFFKESCIHQLQGDRPTNFTLDTMTVPGVAKGCARSLCAVNETLLYRSPMDVCRLGSTMPVPVSNELGDARITTAAAGALGGRYYLCAGDGTGTALFVYDTEKSLWMREDDADALCLAPLDGDLYMLLRNGEVWSVRGSLPESCAASDAHRELPAEWMLETGDIGIDEPFQKHISRMQLHAQCDLGTTVRMLIRYDDERAWTEIFRTSPVTITSITIPFIPKRCRTMRIKLTGAGGFRLYSIVRKTEEGSDVYGA